MKVFRAEPMCRYSIHDVHFGFIDRLFVKLERERPDFYRRMFDEDFARLFHSINHRSGNLFEIVSNDDELMQKLLGNVKTRYPQRSVDEKIRELVEEIAQSLILFGRAYYFLCDDTDQDEIYIASLSSVGVVRLLGTYMQWVPRRRKRRPGRDDEELPREIRFLDATKVIHFDMPKSVKRMLSAQNKTLTVLDKYRFSLSQAIHESPKPTNHFDFRLWSDSQARALYRATRDTGWNGRKYDSSKRSDFFDCHRLIRFRRNQLKLRDYILNQISGELSRVGKGYNAEFTVEISGTDELPSIIHLNELEAKLASEEVGFNEVIDYCYKY